jgi:hypothetical protein
VAHSSAFLPINTSFKNFNLKGGKGKGLNLSFGGDFDIFLRHSHRQNRGISGLETSTLCSNF